ncbi:hypothetical protein DPMN_111080 [Dreissena polymorpha]|uniref:Uncharacterized protein n=1 Tax=Dreissena polymorpha TaxID=45954 RepID=A0A9D4KDY2_DREPO|nr:hypothetical protein DPMN_111080 [Dreissena polymorpha]
MVIPYLMEVYPKIFARLYSNQIGLSNAINSVNITQSLKPEYMVQGVPTIHVPGTGRASVGRHFIPITGITNFKTVRVDPLTEGDTVKTDRDARILMANVKRTLLDNIPVLNKSWTPQLHFIETVIDLADTDKIPDNKQPEKIPDSGQIG